MQDQRGGQNSQGHYTGFTCYMTSTYSSVLLTTVSVNDPHITDQILPYNQVTSIKRLQKLLNLML